MDYDSVVAQRAHVLLTALSEMGGARSKQEVLEYVQSCGYMDLRGDDWEHYPAHTEPKWHTDLAWARQACVEREWMFQPDEKDHWSLTRLGLEKFKKFEGKFQSGEWNVRRCFLWSVAFKKKMCSGYEPSNTDRKRPGEGLRDFV